MFCEKYKQEIDRLKRELEDKDQKFQVLVNTVLGISATDANEGLKFAEILINKGKQEVHDELFEIHAECEATKFGMAVRDYMIEYNKRLLAKKKELLAKEQLEEIWKS